LRKLLWEPPWTFFIFFFENLNVLLSPLCTLSLWHPL
jgi:hypothetical protein